MTVYSNSFFVWQGYLFFGGQLHIKPSCPLPHPPPQEGRAGAEVGHQEAWKYFLGYGRWALGKVQGSKFLHSEFPFLIEIQLFRHSFVIFLVFNGNHENGRRIPGGMSRLPGRCPVSVRQDLDRKTTIHLPFMRKAIHPRFNSKRQEIKQLKNFQTLGGKWKIND